MSSVELPSDNPRYTRQIRVPGIGVVGQEALAAARVLCVGAGGLGSPAAIYLAAAGVGMIGLVDDDVVEISNLHRQPLHMTADLGEYKVDSAAAHLRALNDDVTVRTHRTRLDATNVLHIVGDYDLVIDGSDTFDTRYVVSDACTLLGIPHLWAAVLGAGGQASVFDARTGPTYRDLFPRIPDAGSVPSCAQAGVLGVVPGLLGTTLAAEALKVITGYGQPLVGRVAIYDMRTGSWDEVPLRANPEVRRPQLAGDIGAGLLPSITVEQLAHVLAEPGARDDLTVIDVREPHEREDSGVIEGAVNVPLDRVLKDPTRVLEDSAGHDLYVHCATGVRSARAVEALLAAQRSTGAFDQAGIHNVIGGYEAWQRYARLG